MYISPEGLVTGSVNRAELAAAFNEASDEAVRANLAAAAADHGMHVEGDRLVDPSVPRAPEPEPEVSEEPARPAQADNKAAWVDWAVAQGADREDAETSTKADLIELYGSD